MVKTIMQLHLVLTQETWITHYESMEVPHLMCTVLGVNVEQVRLRAFLPHLPEDLHLGPQRAVLLALE